MYQIIEGDTQGLVDVESFIDIINGPEGLSLFDITSFNDIFVTRAPGRLDVMGGIADYSGSLVLEMPIAEATFVGLQRNDLGQLYIVSLGG